jgi:hypothetical protein
MLFVFNVSMSGVPARRALGRRIPMMSISRSDLMPIRAERSDAGLSQCETVIDISQEFSRFSAPPFGFRCFLRPFVFGR